VHVEVGAGDLEGWIVVSDEFNVNLLWRLIYLRVGCESAGEALRRMIDAAARVVGGLVRFEKYGERIWSLPLK
jgi:hypothetical protein